MSTEKRAKRAGSFDAGTPEKKQRSDPELASQTTTSTASTLPEGTPDRPVRVYADGMYLSTLFITFIHLSMIL